MIIYPNVGDVIEVQRFDDVHVGTVTNVVKGVSYPVQVMYREPVQKSLDDRMSVRYEWLPLYRIPSVKIVLK